MGQVNSKLARFGSTRGGKPSWGLGATISITSFFPTKPLGCYGDGGAIFTDDDALANRIAAIRHHGAHIRDAHWCVGFPGRLDALQAAVLLAGQPSAACRWPGSSAVAL